MGLVCAATVLAVCATAAGPLPLKDVEDHWARTQIEELVSRGIIAGYPDGTFRPEELITRMEFVKIIATARGLPPYQRAKASFADVSPAHWGFGYIEAAISAGILDVREYGPNFGPGVDVTRQEMAVLIVRAMGLEGEAAARGGTALEFGDQGDVPAWARGYIALASARGVITGYPDKSFGPKRPARRAEAAAMVWRMLQKLDEEGSGDAGRGQFVGSAMSNKYHWPDCRYARLIKGEHQIWFKDAAAARARGYLPCSVCKPPME